MFTKDDATHAVHLADTYCQFYVLIVFETSRAFNAIIPYHILETRFL